MYSVRKSCVKTLNIVFIISYTLVYIYIVIYRVSHEVLSVSTNSNVLENISALNKGDRIQFLNYDQRGLKTSIVFL